MANNQQNAKPRVNFIGVNGNTFNMFGEPIENEIAKCMIKKYRDAHPNSGGQSKINTWWISLNRQDLVTILLMMEQPNTMGIRPDGVNVHFARYSEEGDNPNTAPSGKNYNGRDTVVFVMSKDGKDVIDLSDIVCGPITRPTSSDAYDHNELNP